jgi:orotate phosphoribosyltransferase
MVRIDMPASEARERLKQIIREESLRYGDFLLASGAKSHYYLDLRRTTTHPAGAALAAICFLDRIAGLGLDAIGGPTLGADPIIGAVAALSELRGTPIRTFIVRSTIKNHGTRRLTEGHLEPGWRVAILDDVVTKAGSILRGVEAVRAAGARIELALCIVDREEGGCEALAAQGLALEPIFRVQEILDGH